MNSKIISNNTNGEDIDNYDKKKGLFKKLKDNALVIAASALCTTTLLSSGLWAHSALVLDKVDVDYVTSQYLCDENFYSSLEDLEEINEDNIHDAMCKLLKKAPRLCKNLKVTITDTEYKLDADKYDIHVSYPKDIAQHYKPYIYHKVVEVLQDAKEITSDVGKEAFVSITTEENLTRVLKLDFKCSYKEDENVLYFTVLNEDYVMDIQTGEISKTES